MEVMIWDAGSHADTDHVNLLFSATDLVAKTPTPEYHLASCREAKCSGWTIKGPLALLDALF